MRASKYRPPPGSQLSVEAKAALWNGLMACARIRVLGYARGGADGKQGPINHIGLELWATFAREKSVEINTAIGRDLLTEFARGITNAPLERSERSGMNRTVQDLVRRHTIEDRSSPVCMGVQRRIVSRDGHEGPWVCGKMAEVWKAYKRMRRAANATEHRQGARQGGSNE